MAVMGLLADGQRVAAYLGGVDCPYLTYFL